MLACRNGYISVVDRSLEAPDIDVYKEESEGLRALSWAVTAFETPEVITRLLEVPGFDVNKGNEEYDDTPLMYASFDGLPEAVRQLLASPGIDVNRANTDGQTPLAWAVERGKCEVVQLLLQGEWMDAAPGGVRRGPRRRSKAAAWCASIRVFRTVEGRTAMDIAVKYLSRELVRKPPFFTFDHDHCAHMVHNVTTRKSLPYSRRWSTSSAPMRCCC